MKVRTRQNSPCRIRAGSSFKMARKPGEARLRSQLAAFMATRPRTRCGTDQRPKCSSRKSVQPAGLINRNGSGVDRDFFPIQVLGVSVLFEILFEHDENSADDGRVVLKTDLGDKVRDNVEQAMGVDDGEGGRRGGGVGDILVGPFGKILDDVGEEFELFNEVGE